MCLGVYLIYTWWVGRVGYTSKIFNPSFPVLKTGHSVSSLFYFEALWSHCGCLFSKPWWLIVIIISQGGCFNSFYIYTCIVFCGCVLWTSKPLWLLVCCVCLLIVSMPFASMLHVGTWIFMCTCNSDMVQVLQYMLKYKYLKMYK